MTVGTSFGFGSGQSCLSLPQANKTFPLLALKRDAVAAGASFGPWYLRLRFQVRFKSPSRFRGGSKGPALG